MPSHFEASSSRSMTRAMSSARLVIFPPSFPFEARRALLLEGRHAFAVVLGEPRLALQVALELELRVERVAARGEHRLLDQAEALGRAFRQLLCKFHPLGKKGFVVHDLPDQAPFHRLLRGE